MTKGKPKQQSSGSQRIEIEVPQAFVDSCHMAWVEGLSKYLREQFNTPGTEMRAELVRQYVNFQRRQAADEAKEQEAELQQIMKAIEEHEP